MRLPIGHSLKDSKQRESKDSNYKKALATAREMGKNKPRALKKKR